MRPLQLPPLLRRSLPPPLRLRWPNWLQAAMHAPPSLPQQPLQVHCRHSCTAGGKQAQAQCYEGRTCRGNDVRSGIRPALRCHRPTISLAAAGDTTKALEDQFECTICRDWMVATHSMVPCGHMFCGACLGDWLPKNPTCPTCR
jgi:Ring finger domain